VLVLKEECWLGASGQMHYQAGKMQAFACIGLVDLGSVPQVCKYQPSAITLIISTVYPN